MIDGEAGPGRADRRQRRGLADRAVHRRSCASSSRFQPTRCRNEPVASGPRCGRRRVPRSPSKAASRRRASAARSASSGGRGGSSPCSSPTAMSGRLQRGRSYARKGQVVELSLTRAWSPRGCRARGRAVQRDHQVAAADDAAVARGRAARWPARRCSARSCWPARCPREIEEVFDACGTPLFPGRGRPGHALQLPGLGQCPASTSPRVCYLLAEAFDDDPFQILAWRGRSRERAARSAAPGRPAARGFRRGLDQSRHG